MYLGARVGRVSEALSGRLALDGRRMDLEQSGLRRNLFQSVRPEIRSEVRPEIKTKARPEVRPEVAPEVIVEVAPDNASLAPKLLRNLEKSGRPSGPGKAGEEGKFDSGGYCRGGAGKEAAYLKRVRILL